LKIITDDSVDVNEVEKLPLYVEWKGRRIRVSSIKRKSYFLSNKRTYVELPYYEEIRDVLTKAVARYGTVEVLLPLWPAIFLKRTVMFVSSIIEGVKLREAKMDSVSLSFFLKSGKPLEELHSFAQNSRTYLLLPDVSVLKKNGVIPEERFKSVITKSVNLVKFSCGVVQVKSSWSVKGAISEMVKEINPRKHFTIVVRHSGKSRLANILTTTLISDFGHRVSLGWMNPVAASRYGHGTVTVSVIPEV